MLLLLFAVILVALGFVLKHYSPDTYDEDTNKVAIAIGAIAYLYMLMSL